MNVGEFCYTTTTHYASGSFFLDIKISSGFSFYEEKKNSEGLTLSFKMFLNLFLFSLYSLRIHNNMMEHHLWFTLITPVGFVSIM